MTLLTPKDSPNACVKVVFPAPRSPLNKITAPGSTTFANLLAKFLVSFKSFIVIVFFIVNYLKIKKSYKKRRPEWVSTECLATSYSSTGKPNYHRRWRAKLLCSAWEQVWPLRYRH